MQKGISDSEVAICTAKNHKMQRLRLVDKAGRQLARQMCQIRHVPDRLLVLCGGKRKAGRMSVENGKVCASCRHCYRKKGKFGTIQTFCDIDDHYIGYVEFFEYWCRHWSKERREE